MICAFLFGISERLPTALVYTFLSHVCMRIEKKKAKDLLGTRDHFSKSLVRVLPL